MEKKTWQKKWTLSLNLESGTFFSVIYRVSHSLIYTNFLSQWESSNETLRSSSLLLGNVEFVCFSESWEYPLNSLHKLWWAPPSFRHQAGTSSFCSICSSKSDFRSWLKTSSLLYLLHLTAWAKAELLKLQWFVYHFPFCYFYVLAVPLLTVFSCTLTLNTLIY